MKKFIFVLIGGAIVCAIAFYVSYSNYINTNTIIGSYSDGKIQFNYVDYYPVINADNIKKGDFLGYIPNNEGHVNFFSTKEKVYELDSKDKSDYIIYKISAFMEEIEILYVSNKVREIPIKIFNSLPIDNKTDINYANRKYHQYLEVDKEIINGLINIYEDSEFKFYAFKNIPSNQWLIAQNKDSKSYYAFFSDFKMLETIPSDIYIFSI